MAAYTDSLIPKRATSDYWLSSIRPGVAALILGGAFGAGVYLGNAEPSSHAALEMAGTKAWLAQVDARSEKLDDIRSELALHYHDELVGPPRDARDRRRAHHAPKPAPAVIASLQKDENHETAKSLRDRLQAVAKSVRESEAAGPTDKVSTAEVLDDADTASRGNAPSSAPAAPEKLEDLAPENVSSAEVQALADQVSLPERADDEERVRLDDAAEDIESIEEPREKSSKDSRRIENALARVLGTSTSESDADVVDAPPMETAHRYYVQVAATPNLEGAQKLVDKLKQSGFAAMVLQGEGKSQEPVYRVRVGPLPDREQASTQVDRIHSQAGMSGFVIRD